MGVVDRNRELCWCIFGWLLVIGLLEFKYGFRWVFWFIRYGD